MLQKIDDDISYILHLGGWRKFETFRTKALANAQTNSDEEDDSAIVARCRAWCRSDLITNDIAVIISRDMLVHRFFRRDYAALEKHSSQIKSFYQAIASFVSQIGISLEVPLEVSVEKIDIWFLSIYKLLEELNLDGYSNLQVRQLLEKMQRTLTRDIARWSFASDSLSAKIDKKYFALAKLPIMSLLLLKWRCIIEMSVQDRLKEVGKQFISNFQFKIRQYLPSSNE